MDKNLKMYDLEKLVLQGLEYESVEKEKAAERKALTRKHGLKSEDAKYKQTTTGQTRDIVAGKLGISGRQWERMRFIYQHRECLLDEEYEGWKVGKISTTKTYSELNENIRYNGIIDKMLDTLNKMQWEIINYEKSYIHIDISHDLESALYVCRDKTKEDIHSCFDRLKQYNMKILSKRNNEIASMIMDLYDLKRKLKLKTHNDI